MIRNPSTKIEAALFSGMVAVARAALTSLARSYRSELLRKHPKRTFWAAMHKGAFQLLIQISENKSISRLFLSGVQ